MAEYSHCIQNVKTVETITKLLDIFRSNVESPRESFGFKRGVRNRRITQSLQNQRDENTSKMRHSAYLSQKMRESLQTFLKNPIITFNNCAKFLDYAEWRHVH